MIKGMHGLFYSSEPEALRAFLRDKLQLSSTDVGEGWLIFDVPEADLGVHPTAPDGGSPSGTHAISFYCDDIKETVAELGGRGVTFDDEISDQGWGHLIHFTMPGGIRVDLYQPKYTKAASA